MQCATIIKATTATRCFFRLVSDSFCRTYLVSTATYLLDCVNMLFTVHKNIGQTVT